MLNGREEWGALYSVEIDRVEWSLVHHCGQVTIPGNRFSDDYQTLNTLCVYGYVMITPTDLQAYVTSCI